MSNVRIEEDLLGKKEVPAQAYYGIHTVRAVENFQISGHYLYEHPSFIRALALVKKACAMANMELATIPKDKGNYIIQACDKLIVGEFHKEFPTDVYQGGAGTSVNMNANEVIANIALEIMGLEKGRYDMIHPNDHVNKSQSTNDVYPTAFRVALFEELNYLLNDIDYLCQGFTLKSKEFETVLKMGRTQLQDAVPMSLGQEFHAFATLMHEESRLTSLLRKLLLEVNLGATAIGTGINAPDGYSQLAVEKLKLLTKQDYVSSEDLIEATSDCGAYVMISSMLKRTAVKLSKISNDLRLLSSGPKAGLKEINLPELQAGSSIMPAKVNPVIPEVVNRICFKVIGNDMTVTMAAEAGQLQLNVMEPVIASSLFESILLLRRACLTLRDKCVNGITANAETCKNQVMNSIGIVTFLDPIIGHAKCDEIGKICAQTGKSVSQVVLEKKLMTQAQLDEVFSTENMLHPKYHGKRY